MMCYLTQRGEVRYGKIIFIDVDGTLVDYENHLPDSAVIAIRKARENGHRVYISTGCSKAYAIERLVEYLQADFLKKSN